MNSNGITMMVETGDDMRAIGERLSKLTHGGDVVLLSGPLGAGKTTFAQGFGAGHHGAHRVSDIHHCTRA